MGKKLKLKLLDMRARIYLYEKTPYPEELQRVIETNESALKTIDEIKELLIKYFTLGYNIDIRLEKGDRDSIYMFFSKVLGKPTPNLYVYMPEEELERWKGGVSGAYVLLDDLERIAREEKEKAERDLKALIDAGLVVEEEEDC